MAATDARALSAKQRARLRALIYEERTAAEHHLVMLEHELSVVNSAREVDTADDEHDPEGPTLSQEWSSLSGRQTDARSDVDALIVAQDRIAAGSYGVCIRCAGPIGFDRLKARPAATLCIGCARALG